MNPPYRKFNDFLIEQFGEKVRKIGLDAGFYCPNYGADGKEGCIFCRNDSFSTRGQGPSKSISQQMQDGILSAQKNLGINKYIAYFQASTNTFADVDELQRLYSQAISFPGVVGLSVATRPDCLSENIIDLLSVYASRMMVWVELGLQSAHDATLRFIRRGHSFSDFLTAVENLSRIPVRICAHLMCGLPNEKRAEVVETAIKIADLPLHEVKIHPLLILTETPLAEMYRQGLINELTLEEYVQQVCDIIERIPPDLVIQRVTAEAPSHMLIAPSFAMRKAQVLNAILNEFHRRRSRQGDKYHRLVKK
jgi:radical SAM protein (TIGR01212 family)